MTHPKHFIAATLMAAMMPAHFLQAGTQAVLPDRTPIQLRLNRNLTSADLRQGEPIDFEVVRDVSSGNSVLIKEGALALGTITSTRSRRRLGRAGRFAFMVDNVRLADGTALPLRKTSDKAGRSRVGTVTGGFLISSAVFFPVAPAFLLVKGKDAVLKKGSEITVYLEGDTIVASPATSSK